MCVCVCVCVCHCVDNTALNSSDNIPSDPPDNHHCSDDVHTERARDSHWRVCPFCICHHNAKRLHKAASWKR